MRIKTIMKEPTLIIDARARLEAARDLMRRAAVRQAPVVSGSRLVGTLAERDVLRALPSSVPAIRAHDWDALLADLRVHEAMTTDSVVLTPETPLGEAARLAREADAEVLPVVDSGELVGTVTASDLLAVLAGLLGHRRPGAVSHILAATSLRPDARPIAEALRLADATGASLTALHVLPSMPSGSPADGAAAEIVMWAEGIRRRLADEARTAMRGLGQEREIRCEVTEGSVAAEVARCAEDLGADLIVIGASRRRWIRPLPATTAEEVARRASCLVLTVATEARP